MLHNALKEKMRRGEVGVGLFVNLYSPTLVEIIGYAGVDYVVIDDEHGVFTYPQIEELIRAAEISGTTPLVRVNYDNSAIQKVLDRGAMGIQVPMVNTKAEAEEAVKKAKFPPMGKRGTAYSVRSARFGSYKGREYLDDADENTLVIVQIETPEAVKNFEEIASVPGIDIVFIGPTDLSISMGYKEQGTSHPAVKMLISDLFRKGREMGVTMGTLAANEKDVKRCADEGAGYILTTASGLISDKFRELVKIGQELS